MKVLIVSHTSMSTYNNMGKTMMSLFSSFDKEELCHFYIYQMVPDVDKCCSCYRITDKDIMKSFCKFRVEGKCVTPDLDNGKNENLETNVLNEKKHPNIRVNRTILLGFRDIMWKISGWYTKDLKKWIDEQKPTCIFVAPGISKFIYNIALKIAKEYNLPIVTYICDDYYFLKKTTDLIRKFYLFFLKNKIKKLMRKTSHIITICRDSEHLYMEEFKVPATTIMTGTNYTVKETPAVIEKNHKFTYMGNLRYNRYKSLVEMGQVLDKINEDMGTQYILEIYSGEKDNDIISSFDGIKSIDFRGFVSGKEYEDVFFSSKILVHTEAFDEVNIEATKYSVSTKIADSLASGIPVFAYGPPEIASMKHLAENDCAIIANSRDTLYDKLIECLNNTDKLKIVAENGLKTADKYHNKKKQSLMVKEIINSVTKTPLA